MAKNHYKFKKTKKAFIAVLLATAVSCTGLAAACANDSDDNTDSTPKKEDTQLLKNGDFEFFNTPSEEALKKDKAEYLIKTPVSGTWSSGGDSSNTKSGIIGTTDTAWNALTDSELAAKLDYNDDLSSSADDYIDYNGMKSRDILYRDTYAALLGANKIKEDGIINEQGYEKYFGIVDGKIGGKPVYRNGEDGEYYFEQPVERDGEWYIGDLRVFQNPDDKEFYRDESYTFCMSVRTQLIENPGTHYNIVKGENDALSTTIDGTAYDVHEDDYGNYYYYTGNTVSEDVDDKNYISNVLMLHNYPTDSNYNGIHQYYTSQSITLEANTAAEISVWVKTGNLKFARGYSQLNEEDRGAYIEVNQTISGNTVDSFKIKAINTEKILADNTGLSSDITNNGWIKYTVYVEACDFGESTLTLNLGLGQADNYEKLNGYAFFDDVQVKKFVNLDAEDCSYKANETKIDASTTCTLTSDKEEKIFVADKAYTDRNLGRYTDKIRNSQDFHYLLNLTSASAETNQIVFGTNVTAALTTEKSATGKLYASAKELKLSEEMLQKSGINITRNNNGNEYTLTKELKNPRITDNDTLGAFPYNETAFAGSIFSNLLAENLTAEGAALPGYTGNLLVMHSRYGAAYTSSIEDNAFKLAGGEHLILSFWVKTSDMKGKTAATLVITDTNDDKNTTSFTIDTTGHTTDVAGEEDIYNGWVQCFFFVANDTATEQQFKIDFQFGNTTIKGTANYYYGWSAIADMQVLKVDEDVYNLTSAGTSSQKFAFTADTDEVSGVEFDSASGTSEIKNGVVNASNYDGYNGASSSVTDSSYRKNYDGKNTNYETNNNGDVTRFAGLINKTHFDNYNNKGDIIKAFGGADSFTDALAAWESVFGKTCYQPLIIVNNLRSYVEQAEATEENYKNYYVEAEDGYSGSEATFEANGKLYRKVRDDEAFDENTEYYSESDIVKVANYGFVGTPKTISASSYEAVSVKVKVSGNATAYIYLVDDTTHKVLGYATPAYTYYYDDEGNVLNDNFDGMTEEEHKSAIVYTLRKDGLFNGKEDGKVYANLGNYKKLYKYSDNESKDFFDENGENITYDNLKTLNFGEKYYSDSNKTSEAAHFLINSEGKNLYEYKNGAYYYIVSDGDEYVTSDVEVNNFDSTYARYVSEKNYGEYAVAVNANNAAKDADGWVTVNFFIHTGSEELKYRLELWSGERGSTGVDVDGNYESGAVAFDYSAITVSENEYTGILNDYELEIREKYINLLKANNIEIPEDDIDRTDLAYYEKLVTEKISAEEVKKLQNEYGYDAKYYAYTLYDSESYVPFNAETAKDGETGYDYSITDEISNEKIAYFTYTNKEMHSVDVFADYSAVQQNIEMNSVDDDDDSSDDDDNNAGEAWLLVSSIVLLVAILITLVSLLLRDVFKKHRRKKSDKEITKNNYRKRQRYIRKLHLSTESEEPAEEPVTENEPSEESGETEVVEPSADEPAPNNDSEPAEEPKQPETASEETDTPSTSEDATPAEEPADDNGEKPAEESGEGENK